MLILQIQVEPKEIRKLYRPEAVYCWNEYFGQGLDVSPLWNCHDRDMPRFFKVKSGVPTCTAWLVFTRAGCTVGTFTDISLGISHTSSTGSQYVDHDSCVVVMTYGFTAEGEAEYPWKSLIQRWLEKLFQLLGAERLYRLLKQVWNEPGYMVLVVMVVPVLVILVVAVAGRDGNGGVDNDRSDTTFARGFGYHQLLKPGLVGLCEDRGLRSDGNRAELIMRLKDSDADSQR